MKKTRLLRTLDEICPDIIETINKSTKTRPKNALALYREYIKTQPHIKFGNFLTETYAMFNDLPDSEKETYITEAARLNPLSAGKKQSKLK